MEKVEIFPTVTWSAGPGCHGGCGQKLYVKDGKLIKVEGLEPDTEYTIKIEHEGYAPKEFGVNTRTDVCLGEIVLDRV